MMEPQFPDAPGYDRERGKRDQGLIWHYAHGFLGHSGGDPGVSTWMGFVPKTDGDEGKGDEGTGAGAKSSHFCTKTMRALPRQAQEA